MRRVAERNARVLISCLGAAWVVACGGGGATPAMSGGGAKSSGEGGSGGAVAAVEPGGVAGVASEGGDGGGDPRVGGAGGDGGGGGDDAGTGVPLGGANAPDAGSSDAGACAADAADLIWMLDNSCSMAVEAAAVQQGINAFATELADRGVDANLVLISSTNVIPDSMCAPNDFQCEIDRLVNSGAAGVCIDAPFGSGMCPDDSQPPHFLHLDVQVGSQDALQIALAQYPSYAHMLRPGVPKHFAVVTDDDSMMDAATFSDELSALGSGAFDAWTFHGLYAHSLCPDAAAIGTVYDDLTAQTIGVRGDLCLQDFPPVFDEIADAVSGSDGATACP